MWQIARGYLHVSNRFHVPFLVKFSEVPLGLPSPVSIRESAGKFFNEAAVKGGFQSRAGPQASIYRSG